MLLLNAIDAGPVVVGGPGAAEAAAGLSTGAIVAIVVVSVIVVAGVSYYVYTKVEEGMYLFPNL